MFSGTGNSISAGPFASRSVAAVASARASLELDSDEEDFRNPTSFFRTLRQRGFFVPQLSLTQAGYSTSASPATSTARSYASNMDDNTAGNGAENPLEIDDSDEEVEVVQVTRP